MERPNVGPEPSRWTEAEQRKVIDFLAKWSLGKLRKHQRLIVAQHPRALGNERAMTGLQIMERLLSAAVYQREFGTA